jgi:hypothetical protein
MGEKVIPEIGPRQIDAVLRFLPVFERPGYRFGEWQRSEGQFPYFSYSRQVIEFLETLDEQNILVPFDWTSWNEERQRYQSKPGALEAAGLLTLRKLLTAHVRADRFVESHLAGVLESGHITAILCRLRQIRDQDKEHL